MEERDRAVGCQMRVRVGVWPGLAPCGENSLEQTCRLLFARTEAASVNSEFTGWSVMCFLKVNHLFCNEGLCCFVGKPSCCVSFI